MATIWRLARWYGLERQRAPVTTGVLDTAGGVVFNGSIDRWFVRATIDWEGAVAGAR